MMKRYWQSIVWICGSVGLAIYGYNCGGGAPDSTVDQIPVMGTLRAFPGAGGFGANASGGRGGRVIAVTTLDREGPGSLKAALDATGPRTIIFNVSGVIDGIAEITHGNVTIAGQTSPCGVVVRGMICDTVYDTGNDCDNIIVRHIRSRPSTVGIRSAVSVLDDGFRFDGASNVMLDHVEASAATDEAIQISGSRNVTVQSSILAETIGEHAQYGGLLLNYSSATKPLQNVSLIGNFWYHLGGRLPEISCEENDRYGPSNCRDSRFNLEISRNYHLDPGVAVMFDNTDATYRDLDLNWYGNEFHVRTGFPYGMMSAGFVEEPLNRIYAAENQMNLYPDRRDLSLSYCCDDFGPTVIPAPIAARVLRTRHAFPDLGRWSTVGGSLQSTIASTVGPFPRDVRTARYIRAIESDTMPGPPYALVAPNGTDADAFSPASGCTATVPLDSDADGMPDSWEVAHGLAPNDPADGTAIGLSSSLMGASGYTNLETYLHSRAADSN